jgi:hypothetical protein
LRRGLLLNPASGKRSIFINASAGELVAKYLAILLEERSLAESGLRQEINLHQFLYR